MSDCLLGEIDDILGVRHSIEEQIYENLIKACESDPNGEIIVPRSIFESLLQERSATIGYTVCLLVPSSTSSHTQQRTTIKQTNEQNEPGTEKLKEKKKKLLHSSSISSWRHRKNSSVDNHDWTYFRDLTDTKFSSRLHLESIALWPVSRSVVPRLLAELRGPGDSTTPLQSLRNIISAKVVSNYPLVPGRPFRDGDPICDRYAIRVYDEHVIFAIADGCNWGKMPRKAAKRATKTVMEVMEKYHADLLNVRTAAAALVLSFSNANSRIMESAQDESVPGPGKTTMAGGILLKGISASNSNRMGNWFFVFASLGDCKLFHYSPESRTIKDLTFANRTNLSDASDPGGLLGGIDGGDTRNLMIGCIPVKEGEFIIGMSDGVHDNFDPQALGISPKELGLPGECWSDVIDEKKGSIVKNRFMEKRLHDELEQISDLSSSSIVSRLVTISTEVTQVSRDFMESHPSEKLPPDEKRFPGKLDHASCVCIMAGDMLCPTDPNGNASLEKYNPNILRKVTEPHQSLPTKEFSAFSESVKMPWKTSSSPGIVRDKRKSFFFSKSPLT